LRNSDNAGERKGVRKMEVQMRGNILATRKNIFHTGGGYWGCPHVTRGTVREENDVLRTAGYGFSCINSQERR
jgi:hypothetical protein